jgi:hypothetical protein
MVVVEKVRERVVTMTAPETIVEAREQVLTMTAPAPGGLSETHHLLGYLSLAPQNQVDISSLR